MVELANGDLQLENGLIIPVAGYARGVSQWNLGKKAKFADKVVFDGSAKRDLRTTKREVHEN